MKISPRPRAGGISVRPPSNPHGESIDVKKLLWIPVLILALIGLVLAQDVRPTRVEAETELAFFFSDSTRDLEVSARALRGLRTNHPSLRIRPVFLAEDFSSLAKPTNEFARGIRELKYAVGEDFGVAVYDEDGLALARRLKLDQLPAYAFLVTTGKRQRAFVACGTNADLEELLRCAR